MLQWCEIFTHKKKKRKKKGLVGRLENMCIYFIVPKVASLNKQNGPPTSECGW
jgi:hypothetical protein